MLRVTLDRQCAFLTCDVSQWVDRYVSSPRLVLCHPYEALSMNVTVVSNGAFFPITFKNQLELNELPPPWPALQDPEP